MKVLKFGGTSLGSAERMQHVADLIEHVDEPCLVVLSAVSGTTNSLIEICQWARSGRRVVCAEAIENLRLNYISFVNQLYEEDDDRTSSIARVGKTFDLLRELIDTPFNIVRDKEILSLGELLSTRLFYELLKSRGQEPVWLNALDFMLTRNGEPDYEYIHEGISVALEKNKGHKIFITQGFICRNEQGEVDNLKRGGSDFTASILGAAVGASEIQIWSDIDGIHNNDPRVVANTYPIHSLSFDEAAEMAYFGAKVLHPSTIHPAKQKNIPVRLLNTMQPDAQGTLINNNITPDQNKVKAVAAKDGITAINIRSHRMLMAHGYLREVFEVFERYGTSIDMITTSEVAVSVTIDDAEYLDNIVDDLRVFAQVQIDRDQTIVCVVGEFSKEEAGVGVRILDSLASIPIRMISSGGSDSNISVLIDSSFKTRALELLNEHLFGL